MTTRTIYRDIRALEDELGMPIFQAGRGRYGIEKKYFLPPLRLTLPEAVVLFLASRLIARWSDEYDQAVVSAFTKLADLLPQPIARHVAATMLNVGRADPNEPFTRNFAARGPGLGRWTGDRVRLRARLGGSRAPACAGATLLPGARCRRPQRLPHRLRRDGRCHAHATRWSACGSSTLTADRYEIPPEFDPDALAEPLLGHLVIGHDRGGRGAPALRGFGCATGTRVDLAPLAEADASCPTGGSRCASRWPASSRSGRGSSPGATRSKCWRPSRCATVVANAVRSAAARYGG